MIQYYIECSRYYYIVNDFFENYCDQEKVKEEKVSRFFMTNRTVYINFACLH